jgi:cytochrome P450
MSSVGGCPAHVPAHRVREFDYVIDPARTPTPFDKYLEYRGQSAFWTPNSTGYWVLTDYESIRDAYQDAATFSSVNVGVGYSGWDGEKFIPLQIDPPQHKRYRSLLAPFFTPAVAARMEPEIRSVCAQIVDRFADDGEGDVLELFSGRLPQSVFLKILNLPLTELETFRKWEHDLVYHPQIPEEAERSRREMDKYLTAVVAERAAHPIEGDLLSQLISGTIDDRPVTQAEVVNIAGLLFLAGLDTVTTALTFSLHYLATHPDARRELLSKSEIAAADVEELLRYHSFISVVRTAARDTEFHGISLKTGDRVLLPSALAARDPEQFENPDEVVFGRQPNRHLGFGGGIHRCAGSHLAVVQMRVGLEEFHRRIPHYEVPEDAHLTYHGGGQLGLDRLPLTWKVSQPASG